MIQSFCQVNVILQSIALQIAIHSKQHFQFYQQLAAVCGVSLRLCFNSV